MNIHRFFGMTRLSAHIDYLSTQAIAHIIRLWAHQRIQHICYLLVGIIVSFLLIQTMLQLTPPSFAKTASFETCATALANQKGPRCNGEDPIIQGCSRDAMTVKQAMIIHNGRPIGLAQLRYSANCGTYWARGFSYLVGTGVTVYVQNLGKQDTASYLSDGPEAYSNMIYLTGSARPTVVVGVVGETVTLVTLTGPEAGHRPS